MTDADRERWDAKHAGAHGEPPGSPDEFLVQCLDELALPPGSRVLDLAAGAGRNSLFLAERGYAVEAWDLSSVGLSSLAARALERDLAVTTRVVDLDSPPALCEPFDLVVVVNFLDRGLYGELSRFLRAGGHAVVAHFTTEWPEVKPSPRHRLGVGELAAGLAGLVTLASVESGGRAGLLAQRSGASS